MKITDMVKDTNRGRLSQVSFVIDQNMMDKVLQVTEFLYCSRTQFYRACVTKGIEEVQKEMKL